MQTTALSRWDALDGARTGFINRCEDYARWTLPKICLPVGFTQNNYSQQHEWQAVGAQAVNNLANKIMLALFAPSRPFFRYEAEAEALAELEAAGISEQALGEILAAAERKAVKNFEALAARPKFFEIIKHLVITGNVLVYFQKKAAPRVLGIKKFCVKRNVEGKMIELLIREDVLYDELGSDVRVYLASRGYARDIHSQQALPWIKWLRYDYDTKQYMMTSWVENFKLPTKFDGKWPEDKCPYQVVTWDLDDASDYGTGLVEDYSGDFSALSTLSKAQIEAAILASEFRWLINPGGMTKPDDFMNSENGACLPGVKEDMSLLNAGTGQQIPLIQAVAAEYVTRIGRGFLLGSTVQRQAERVTAEEVRYLANELETSLGGAYSRLAVDLQGPTAKWLSASEGLEVKGNKIKPVVITGLDALSRNGDLEALKLFLADMGAVTSLPEPLQRVLRLREIASELAAGRGVQSSKFVLSDDEIKQATQQQQAQQAETQAIEAGTKAGAAAAATSALNQGVPQ